MKNQTFKNNIKKVKRLINKGWTQGASARNKYGHEVDPSSKSAAKFCLLGAIYRVGNKNFHTAYNMEKRIRPYCPFGLVTTFNDGLPRGPKGKKEVIKVLDKVIKSF